VGGRAEFGDVDDREPGRILPRNLQSSRSGRGTARRSTRSGACSLNKLSSGCSSGAPAASISRGSVGSVWRRMGSRISAGLSDVLDAATGVADRGGARARPGRCVLCPSRPPTVPIDTASFAGDDQLDYLQEPDVFHDICGHVPLLMNPVFADYMTGLWGGRASRRRASGIWHRRLGAALLVHRRVRADCHPRGPAHLWLRDPILRRRVGLFTRRPAAKSGPFRIATGHAHHVTASTPSKRPSL